MYKALLLSVLGGLLFVCSSLLEEQKFANLPEDVKLQHYQQQELLKEAEKLEIAARQAKLNEIAKKSWVEVGDDWLQWIVLKLGGFEVIYGAIIIVFFLGFIFPTMVKNSRSP